jgi:hypothetical protein
MCLPSFEIRSRRSERRRCVRRMTRPIQFGGGDRPCFRLRHRPTPPPALDALESHAASPGTEATRNSRPNGSSAAPAHRRVLPHFFRLCRKRESGRVGNSLRDLVAGSPPLRLLRRVRTRTSPLSELLPKPPGDASSFSESREAVAEDVARACPRESLVCWAGPDISLPSNIICPHSRQLSIDSQAIGRH